jgi:hypothetical protein
MIAWITGAMVVGILVGGLVCLALPLKWWLRARRRMRAGGVADGRVVALRPQASAPEESYVTVFQFNDRQGGSHRVSSRVAHWPAQHAIGQRVRVVYEPANPEDAELATDTSTVVQLVVLGLFLSVIALLLLWGLSIGAFVPQWA